MSLLPFDESLESFAGATALIRPDGRQVSYGHLAEKADSIAGLFGKKKQLVLIRCRPEVEMVAAYLAVLRSGQAAMLIDDGLEEKGLTALLESYRPEWLAEPEQPGCSYAYLQDGYGIRRTGFEDGGDIYPELALLLSTSGSTGSAKMVRLSKTNLHANAFSIVKYLAIDGSDRAISSLPFHYSYGLSVLNSHLAAGAAIVLTEASLISRDFWNMVKDYEITSFAGVPYHYEMLLRLGFLKMELPALLTLTQAGGRLKPEYIEKFYEYAKASGKRFFVMYGQTEASPRIAYVPSDKVGSFRNSIGRAVPGGRLWLADPQGQPVAGDDAEGELVYEGPNVMMGYADRRKDLAAGDLLGGRLYTGDMARMESNGFFAITGRLKRFLKLFGNRVNLDEIERMLQEHGHEAICGGEDNSLCVLITGKDREDEVKKEVCAFLKIHHSAIRVAAVDSFKTTSSGKIDYPANFTAPEEGSVGY